MLGDMARGGMPSMVDRKQFKVGTDLAATPGAVVYRDQMFELLQYTPTTPKVRAIPCSGRTTWSTTTWSAGG